MRIHRHLSVASASRCAVERSVVQRWRGLLWGLLAAAGLICGTPSLLAQADSSGGKSVWDKSKTKTKLLERYRAKLEVKDDAEWTVIEKRIDNVLWAEHELQVALAAGHSKIRSSKSSASGAESTGRSEQARVFDGAEEIRQLQQLVAEKAPAQEIKPRLARVRELLKLRQEKLATAREDLRTVLSSRQEAIAVLNGLLR